MVIQMRSTSDLTDRDRQEYQRQYRAANKERLKEQKRQYRAANAERLRAYNIQWEKDNPEKAREKRQRYRAKPDLRWR